MAWKDCWDCGRYFDENKDHCPFCGAARSHQPTYEDAQLALVHFDRIVHYGDHWFIAKRILDMYEDYYGAGIGDIIVCRGLSGRRVYFELAGDIEGWGPQPEAAFLLTRVDPDTHFDDLPVLDVDPEKAVILRLDKAKEEGGSGDEAS